MTKDRESALHHPAHDEASAINETAPLLGAGHLGIPTTINEIPAHVNYENEDDPYKPLLPLWKLFALTSCMFGVQIGWGLQIAASGPILLNCGFGKENLNYSWLPGPIAGLLIQPIVGVLSDRTTLKLGRRRPYLLIGWFCILVGEILISNAQKLGVALGDEPQSSTTQQVTQVRSIVIAMLGIWILDLSNNMMQGPLRALLVDVAPADQQNLGGSLFSGMIGAGSIVGFLIAAGKWDKWFTFVSNSYQVSFTLASIILTVTVLTVCLFIKETPLRKDQIKNAGNPFVELYKGIRRMPTGMVRICAVQFWAWFGWFCVLVYGTAWVSTEIFGGSEDESKPNHPQYLEGNEWAAIAFTAEAGVSVAVSVLIPLGVKFIGVKPIYAFAQAFFGVALLLSHFITNKWQVLVFFASLGLPWAIVMSLPFLLVSMAVKPEESGLFMGVLNIFVVLPQFVVALGFGQLVKHVFDNRAGPLFLIGACASLVASVLCFFLVTKKISSSEQIVLGGGGGH
eukprot:TRINITY_DN10130_c0_g1_i1.p1 TRINITY_DN10130_c0_g1~~TRINITY_DN10130_c0_g1_i1.p1  ORF type:complete len:511 (-),score=163.11 TRINITY_DN10130_c0_g1_i1:106-1638(-)